MLHGNIFDLFEKTEKEAKNAKTLFSTTASTFKIETFGFFSSASSLVFGHQEEIYLIGSSAKDKQLSPFRRQELRNIVP